MFKIVLTVGFMALFYLSLSRRVEEKQRARKKSRELPIEPRESPFSQAQWICWLPPRGVPGFVINPKFSTNNCSGTHSDLWTAIGALAALSLLIAVFQPYLGSVLRRPS